MELIHYAASLAIFLIPSPVLIIGAHLLLRQRSRATATELFNANE